MTDWICHKGSDVEEPFRAATTELTIIKVDTEEQLRPDRDRCYHGEMLAVLPEKKTNVSSSNSIRQSSTDKSNFQELIIKLNEF